MDSGRPHDVRRAAAPRRRVAATMIGRGVVAWLVAAAPAAAAFAQRQGQGQSSNTGITGLSPFWQNLLTVLFVLFVPVGIWLWIRARRLVKDENEVGDLTLADIRKLLQDGQVTQSEYEAMRQLLIHREREKLAADSQRDPEDDR